MCGIVGTISQRNVVPLLLEGLKRLEYRGYDSAGIATLVNGSIHRRRAQGKLANLAAILEDDPIVGDAGIGHTRWATHGVPNESNAHPHATARVAVVHNGIIENFRELRAELSAKGVTFVSETDTETVALLTQLHMNEGLSPIEAATKTIKRLHGAFALALLFDGEPDLMIGARKGAPLAIGYGDNEMFLGSDAIALSPMTDRLTYLEEGDMAILRRASVEIYDAHGQLANRAIKTISLDLSLIHI